MGCLNTIKPILVFGIGNPSRGDDALGPMLLEYIEQCILLQHIEILSDYQLQPEHALDMQGRKRVLFVDASVMPRNNKAVEFVRVQARMDQSYTTHAMTPSALLHVYHRISGTQAPQTFLLRISGCSFELGDALSAQAHRNLTIACRLVSHLLRKPESETGFHWTELVLH